MRSNGLFTYSWRRNLARDTRDMDITSDRIFSFPTPFIRREMVYQVTR